MTLEKRMIEDVKFNWEERIVEQKEVFVETKTEVQEIVWHKDMIESQIAQKQNLIDNTQLEIQQLQAKLDQIISLEAKPK